MLFRSAIESLKEKKFEESDLSDFNNFKNKIYKDKFETHARNAADMLDVFNKSVTTDYKLDDVKSHIAKSGFDGDVVLVGTNMKKETIDKLTSLGVRLSLYGNKNEAGDVEAKSGLPPHVERFFYIWDFLSKTKETYNHVIVTDTRDVIFQTNPSDWLKENMWVHELVAASEGMRYKNEPWGNTNLFQSFGGYFHNKLKENYIFNVGVIAGTQIYVTSLMLMIFQMSLGRPIPITDQSTFNFLINTKPYSDASYMTTVDDSWAVQLGTTQAALDAGHGDIGKDEEAKAKYKEAFLGSQPVINGSEVTNASGEKYVIVHQWDRIPTLMTEVVNRYGS